ncbi:transmembrane protein 200C-like [Scomber japonicus]|uniref:transmembrane protein 200C-like n=1 Tax=Scomber japonicus TaxID=13676 RepID=UPI002305D134|nr:transmembrane protein 200C-like [Scomber japonicus]
MLACDWLSRSEVVVVKGKLKLFSLSGLVAALGVVVLLVGVVMATLGYWPRDGLFFSGRPQEGATLASVSSPHVQVSGTSSHAGGAQGGGGGGAGGGGGDEGGAGGGGGGDEGFNQSESINGTSPRSFLEDFLDRYLSSDRLKVLGPLVMGGGVFVFICANAVLHETRDLQTKVIDLRDIYSTVIDLHRLRPPAAPPATCTGSAPPPPPRPIPSTDSLTTSNRRAWRLSPALPPP